MIIIITRYYYYKITILKFTIGAPNRGHQNLIFTDRSPNVTSLVDKRSPLWKGHKTMLNFIADS